MQKAKSNIFDVLFYLLYPLFIFFFNSVYKIDWLFLTFPLSPNTGNMKTPAIFNIFIFQSTNTDSANTVYYQGIEMPGTTQ